MEKLIITKRGQEFREKDVIEIEKFHKHCLDNCLQGTLIIYSPLWKIVRKFRKKQSKNK